MTVTLNITNAGSAGKLFADSAAEREISADDVRVPAAHTLGELVPRKNATCVADGVRAHYRCTECGAYFDADDTTTPVGILSLIIPSKDGAHDLRLITAAAPSCTGDGHVEYYECRLCGKLFADSAAEREISADDVEISRRRKPRRQDLRKAISSSQSAPRSGSQWTTSISTRST